MDRSLLQPDSQRKGSSNASFILSESAKDMFIKTREAHLVVVNPVPVPQGEWVPLLYLMAP